MAYKDLLLQLSSYQEVTASSAVEQAVRFAEFMGARLTALTFEIAIRVPANPLAVAILDIPGMVAAERAKSIDNARDLANIVDSTATKHSVGSNFIYLIDSAYSVLPPSRHCIC